jgi:hypothetical protein
MERVRGLFGLIVAVALVAGIVADPATAYFGVPALLGGLAIAGFLLLMHRRRPGLHLEDATDGPSDLHDNRTSMFNLSSVRPSGIGGLGLSFMAVLAALQFREGQTFIVFTILGGTLVAGALIALRKRTI